MHGDARGWRLSLSEIVRIVLKETVALIWKLFQIYADFFFSFLHVYTEHSVWHLRQKSLGESHPVELSVNNNNKFDRR